MNANQIINMIFRMFLRRGINEGINRIAGGGTGGRSHKDMTPEERANAKAGRENAKRAQQALRVGRRIGRF